MKNNNRPRGEKNLSKKKRKTNAKVSQQLENTEPNEAAEEAASNKEPAKEPVKEPAKEPPKEKRKTAHAVKGLGREQDMSGTKLFLLLAFLVPFLIMGVVFIKADIHPFGDRQVLYSDCKQQYLPFLKEFQRKLKSGDSMFYTWHSGMGTNFLAIIGYYVASPLNLLTLFVPIKYIREALAVLIMIKIGCSSLFTAMFLKYVYRRNDLSLVAFGCCYAFCDYMMGYYWNTIWLDSVALLPLVALGVYCIVREGKFKLYIIALALAFLSSYYIGYMICVFVILWFVVQSIVKESNLEELFMNILKMAGYSLIALSMTLPVTLVSYLQLQNTVGTEDEFPDKIELYNNFMKMIANLFSFHETTTMEGLPNVGTGVICILMLVIFIRSKDISKKEKISYLSLLVFLFVSLNINMLDYIWHGFHFPNLIPYRFAFLFSFVFIVVAYRAFTVFVELDKKDIIGMCIVTIVMVCISVFYLEQKAIIASLIAAALYIIMMTMYELDLLDRRLLVVFTSLVIIAEMCFEANIGVTTVGTTSWDNYPHNEEQVMELVDYAEEQNGNELYRLDQNYYSTKNDGMIYGYNSAGQFSSTSYKTLIDFTSDFGMVSKRSSFQYLLTSPVVAMMLNEKYLIARDGYSANESSLTEYKKSSDNEVTLYENKYYLPIGYMSDNRIAEIGTAGSTVFDTQNHVFSALTGINENVYTMLTPSSFDCVNFEYDEEEEGLYNYSMNAGQTTGEISVTYNAPKDGMLYAWANVKSNEVINVKSASIDHDYNIEAQRYVFPLGYYEKGEAVILNVVAEKDATNKIAVAYLNSDVLDRGYENLSDETLNVTKYTSRTVEGIVNVKKNGTFMTSIPYEKGWTLYVDGNKTETKAALDSFLCADLSEGEHTIELKYTPEGFVTGMIGAIIALAAFVFLCFWDKARIKKEEQK